MSNNQKKGKNKLDVKYMWKDGQIHKGARITYDIAWNIILFFIILGVVGLFFAGGVGAGYFASLVKDEPVRSKEEMEKSIYNYAETSEIYFTGEKYLANVQSDIYREEVSLDQISKHLRNAVIATEDVNFNSHNGVVPKAVMRAVMQEVTNSSVKTGGSTLTQQIVKNQILTNEVSFERKAKEMLIALRVERFFEKDKILETYLNIVPFGRNTNGENIAGVQTAAQGIFGVDASELSIAQAAYIAGLPQAPFAYTPFDNDGTLKSKEELQSGIDRMHEVLERMLEAGYITEAQYNKAKQFKINKETLANPTKSASQKYPYLVPEIQERAKDILVDYLAKENGHTEKDLAEDESLREEYITLAERKLSSGGLKIHTTIDQAVYDKVQEVKNAYQNYGRNKTIVEKDPETGELVEKEIPVQVGSMIIENATGKIIAFIGGRDFDTSQVNHATQAKRSNGSTMKPLLVYAPSMEMGVTQPGSVIADVPYYYPGTNNDVNNYSNSHHGFVSARYALAKSYNIPAVKTYSKIVGKNPAKNYLEKMGFTSLVKNENTNDYANLSMALGGLSYGVTVEENTNAYTTFGNMGNFVDAYMIEKIETADGETIYQHQPKKTKIFSPQTAYLTIDMMRDVLEYGTASGVRSQLAYPGVDWAGKTGTSQSFKDSWFVATNPNVTVGMWTGYRKAKGLDRGYSSRTQGIWADVVNAVSKIRPELMVPDQGFQSPGGLVRRSYCATSGLLASDLCASVGLARSDIYNAKYAPTKVDDSLIAGDFVQVKDQLVVAGSNTPAEFIIDGGGVTLSPEFLKENGYLSPHILRQLLPNTGAWKNVALPSGGSASMSSSVGNDGQAPAAPSSVSARGSTINWTSSPSNDVVGYRIYRAPTPSGAYSLIGSSTDTQLSFSGSEGVYAVRAVDYFGSSSKLSTPAIVGNPTAPEPGQETDPNSNNDNTGSGSSNSNSSSSGDNAGSNGSPGSGGNSGSNDGAGSGDSSDSSDGSGSGDSSDSSDGSGSGGNSDSSDGAGSGDSSGSSDGTGSGDSSGSNDGTGAGGSSGSNDGTGAGGNSGSSDGANNSDSSDSPESTDGSNTNTNN